MFIGSLLVIRMLHRLTPKRCCPEYGYLKMTLPSIQLSWLTIASLLLITLSFSGCKKPGKPVASFYYWKTTFDISEKEKDAIKDNNLSEIYVRYFDIILKDKDPVPLSPIHFKNIPEINIIPVIFIKNDVFLQSSTDLNILAGKTWKLIGEISNHNNIRYNEIQLDCDWSIKSRERYFQFIGLLNAKSSKKISATIRLHQIKYYRDTGVPPVDKGVLMYYNMGRIAPDTLNSVYDRSIALNYVKSLNQYPLSLNIALPIFSWAVQIRDNKVIDLVNKVDKNSFISDSTFSFNGVNIFIVKENILKSGYFFKKGDKIKIESVSDDDLKQMCHDLRKNVSSTPEKIIFYDLDAFNLENYNHGKNFFQKICNLF